MWVVSVLSGSTSASGMAAWRQIQHEHLRLHHQHHHKHHQHACVCTRSTCCSKASVCSQDIHTHACTHTYIHTSTYVQTHKQTHTDTYTRIHTRTSTHARALARRRGAVRQGEEDKEVHLLPLLPGRYWGGAGEPDGQAGAAHPALRAAAQRVAQVHAWR